MLIFQLFDAVFNHAGNTLGIIRNKAEEIFDSTPCGLQLIHFRAVYKVADFLLLALNVYGGNSIFQLGVGNAHVQLFQIFSCFFNSGAELFF